mmetsp:Transcript_30111/g.92121  ORF Transcript_30111/g.92121 Transcript_30111/m.92121 type:complete len:312 (-) Transcript_30111:159-1094(-)
MATKMLCGLLLPCAALRMSAEPPPQKTSLYVVGCGVLGTAVAKEWLRRSPSARVVAETHSARRHPELQALGCETVLREERSDGSLYDAVLVCTPPSAYASGDEYAREIRDAARLVDDDGAFLMTSSGGVFLEDQGGTCDETSPVSSTPRSLKILAAEDATRDAGGSVLRLAGLYRLDRGAHVVWLEQGTVPAAADSLVNCLHYDDAATAAVQALERGAASETFLAADMHPRSRQAIADAARRHPKFRHYDPVLFVGTEHRPPDARGPRGKGRVYDCSRTMAALGWAPKFPSVESFFDSAALPAAAPAGAST